MLLLLRDTGETRKRSPKLAASLSILLVPSSLNNPKGTCINIEDTLAPKYVLRGYFKAKVYSCIVTAKYMAP